MFLLSPLLAEHSRVVRIKEHLYMHPEDEENQKLGRNTETQKESSTSARQVGIPASLEATSQQTFIFDVGLALSPPLSAGTTPFLSHCT